MCEDTKVRDIGDIFQVFGKYQLMQYMYLCLPGLFITMININFIFVAGDLDYRCRIAECEGPESTAKHPTWWPDLNIDRCSRPVVKQEVVSGVCTNASFTGVLAPCDQWIYESNNTVVAELNLGCQPWKINSIGTIRNTGMLFSMIGSGWITDRFGRKPTIIFCTVASFIGLAKTFTTSYYMYIMIEFLESFATGGLGTAVMVLLLEISGKKYRLAAGVVFSCLIYLGESLFALIAMFVPYWKTLVRIINGPCLLFLSYILLVHESPRWQIVSGRVESAKASIKRIAKSNNINIDFEELANINADKLKSLLNIQDYEVKKRFSDIFTSREMMKRLIVSAISRFSSSLVYYGLMINSVWLPGDKYVNFLLSTVVSFPGEFFALYLMNRIGRKLPLMVGYAITGVMVVLSGYVPASYVWVKIAAFLISKMIIAVCSTGAITYSMELFPTSARGSMLGLCSFASKVGGMLAPLTPILNTISPALPSILFGCAALLTGGLIFLTPETRNLPLMDTIQQVHDFSKRNQETHDKHTATETNVGVAVI